MQWGTNKESGARKVYVKCMKSQHIKWSINETGLCLNPDYPVFGASPDGMIDCICCGKGCLEIKCPFLLRSSAEISTSYLEIGPNGEKHLKREHNYYYQVQTHMFITSTKYCDFVVWAPLCKPFIERIEADPALWDIMSRKAKLFHSRIIMPELCFKHFTERPCIEFSSIAELKRVDIDVVEETVLTEQAGENLCNNSNESLNSLDCSNNKNKENGSPMLHINVEDSSPDTSPCAVKDMA